MSKLHFPRYYASKKRKIQVFLECCEMFLLGCNIISSLKKTENNVEQQILDALLFNAFLLKMEVFFVRGRFDVRSEKKKNKSL